MHRPGKIPKFDENMDHELARRVSLHSDIPDWLQEFTENLVDERVPEHRYSHASSSHESSTESLRKVASGNHSIYIYMAKDRNFEICQRIKLTRAPHRVKSYFVQQKFGDLITTDQKKVLSEGCEFDTITDMQLWC